MKMDEIFAKNLPTLFAVFFNTSSDGMDFKVISDFRETKFAKLKPDDYENTKNTLSLKYDLPFEWHGGTKIFAKIYNPERISLDDFRRRIYEAILPKITSYSSRDFDAELALAMFIFRGSVDFSRSLYAVDLKDPSEEYLDDFTKILLSSDKLLNRLNLNFRELQPQFVSGTNKRNTQIRVNLKWFYDDVMCQFLDINPYKSRILRTKFQDLGSEKAFYSFENRIEVYREKIVGRKLTKDEIGDLRSELEFREEIGENRENQFNVRNQKIVAFARETFDDICVGCSDIYKISDRSFRMPRNNRFYFEINHVIAYASDAENVDVLDNLVKLCPTCHRALTPHRASEELQRLIINNMLDSREEVRRFILSMIGGSNVSPADFVFARLR